MKQPSLDKLLRVVDSKYTLVVAVAKRARLLNNGEISSVQGDFIKPVTIAMHELAENKIICRRLKKIDGKQ
ncbi:MAG: DNA-directed RNA polymerase subunit omega [Clostridia bacterium]|jgi:DNA-directed RNA polymerase subunit omega|nr:DNA-directed RNA polymerase subunit omega [Clostridia bacterium]